MIAFASVPGFDPNGFARGLSRADYSALEDNIDRPLFNRVLRGAYPPGSTIKPVMALAALSYAIVDPEQVRYCRGFFTLPGSSRHYRDWKPAGHGWVNLREAVAQSCDTYFYGVAQALGIDRMTAFLTKVGLGQRTGIDIDGEKPGLVPSREWKEKTFAREGDRWLLPNRRPRPPSCPAGTSSSDSPAASPATRRPSLCARSSRKAPRCRS